jgi:hypothetical protein
MTGSRIALLLVLLAAAPCLADEMAAGENIVIRFESVSSAGSDAKDFARRVAEERRKIRGWWGPAFEDRITILVEDDLRITMALIPAWRGNRGELQVPTRRFLSGDAATLHELTHIYAPNGNRFLAEGLAVWAHEALGGVAAFPTKGRKLHAEAKDLAADADLTRLDAIGTPGRLPDERTSYTVAGSFVGFLIERYGLEKFRALYAETPFAVHGRDGEGHPARWAKHYGRPLPALAAEWKAFLAGK